jgi:hypothetical protein
MTVLSMPAASRRMAAVCRRTWGVMVLPVRLGQDAAAVRACAVRRTATASRLSRVPPRVVNTNPLAGCSGGGGRWCGEEVVQDGHGLVVQRGDAVLASFAVG